MNIFVVSPSQRVCARALDDARLRKMILETAQMLCTAVNLEDGKQTTPYRNTHIHNPLVKWAGIDRNWQWLLHLGIAYGDEYRKRFGKRHASSEVIDLLYRNPELRGYGQCTYWHNAARNAKHGIDFTHIQDVHKAYRLYLSARWEKERTTPRPSGRIIPPTWANRRPPPWSTYSAG